MNRKDLINKTVEVLKENNVYKPTPAQKTVLHISDDYGNKSDFTIKKTESRLLFTITDVAAVIDAYLAVVEDSIKRGEDVSIHGFGSIGLRQRAPRQTKHPVTGETVKINARYVPKFSFGNTLRTAARIYEMSIKEGKVGD